MIHGHVSTELAAALPREVIEALGLLPGDPIDYVIDGAGVRITRSFEDEEPDLGPASERLKALIQEGLSDPRPAIPGGEVFADLRARIEQRRRDGG